MLVISYIFKKVLRDILVKKRRVLFLHLSQIRKLVQRFAIALLFLAAFFLMLFSKNDNVLLEKTSNVAGDIMTPAVEVLVMPGRLLADGYNYLRSLRKIDEENRMLREENRRLTIANAKTRALEIENSILSQMLNYAVPPGASFVTAKVVAETGDVFSHAVIVYIGNNGNVQKGQVAISDKGVIGRVESVGRNYAKIFLINDINSKIPVMIEKSRVRAILAGENTPLPKMLFMPLDAEPRLGDTVVTSGIGGVFPSGLPVGKIVRIDEEGIKVKPFNDLNRIEYVQIVDYHLPLLEEGNSK